MHVGFNKYQAYGKMVLLVIIILFAGLLFFIPPSLKSNSTTTPLVAIIFLVLIALLVFFMSVLMTLQLLLLPKGVSLDNENKLLTLTFFGTRPYIIKPNDLTNFSSTLVKTKSTNYEGILLNLKDGKKYLLSDFNLKDYWPIKAFLEQHNVAYAGHEKFSFIIYFINYCNH